MKFGTKGTLPSEAIIDVAQRVVAQLQDADVTHVANLSCYMAVIDKNGERRELMLDGRLVDEVIVPCDDLMECQPTSTLQFAKQTPSYRFKDQRSRKRRA